MLFIAFLALVGGAFCILILTDVISLADPTVRSRLLDKRTLEEAREEHKRFKTLETSGLAERFFRGGALKKIEYKLLIAGHPPTWTLRNIVIIKIVLPLLFFFAASSMLLNSDTNTIIRVMLVIAIIVSFFVPDLLVGSKGTERQAQIEMGLPDILDKLYLSLKAGLGFDSALTKTLESSSGPAADELIRTTQDIRVGMPRREAYESLRFRTKPGSMHDFIRAVAQAEEKGVSIASIVSVQAKELRIKRRLRAEGKAAQTSIKLMGPMFLCIFPVLFVVLLAPGVFNAFATL